jgi:hypothetical protein
MVSTSVEYSMSIVFSQHLLRRLVFQVETMLTKDELDDFLTSVCYPHIITTVYEIGTPKL